MERKHNKIVRTLLLVFVLLSIATGCATVRPLATPSGKPELVLPPQVTKAQARDMIVNGLVGNGYELKRSDEYSLVFGKPTQSGTIRFLYGSSAYPTPEERLIVNFLSTDTGAVRLIFTMQYVTNTGSAFEKITDASTGADAQQAQEQFDRLMRGSKP
jgi:hypothetical protein